ncbi:redox-sensitive transcriptional activator SoxR [Aeoliella mucimassa]|uniref:Redox-sensitive transcriptional activator SoxR n=1 Tax=Aeoliella mucimassa TaxID=2527972 RepID=A0A518AHS2_9BACT|nr:redox-sensitive transcriptional activator SoxR [Aeoliella mucimassa]QDU54281.1 Redox-sensitive transcriptional activator SoxR [Aeoliella mucimassa]
MSSQDNDETLLAIGELAQRSGIAVSAIHFYESKGLVRSTRNKRNQRLFSRRELRVLGLIKVAQDLGFTLDEIGEAFSGIPTDRVPTTRDWQRVSRALDEALQAKIELATRMRNKLNQCIGCGCLSLNDCPLRNPSDELAEKGPGPHLLR